MIPITISAVGEAMLRVAGQVADGVRLHPLCSRRYLLEICLPLIKQGMARSGRARQHFDLHGGGFIATGADAAALAFDALKAARAEGADLLLIDTAGRLHNRADLMAELEKLRRVIRKLDPTAPHAVLLVLDATTGQNALSQVEIFRAVIEVSGLVVTKLDGSAKGGVLLALAERFGLPIHAIGVGEGADDLRPFAAADFGRSLMGLEA